MSTYTKMRGRGFVLHSILQWEGGALSTHTTMRGRGFVLHSILQWEGGALYYTLYCWVLI